MNWLNGCWHLIDTYTHENADRLYNIAYWSGGVLGVLFSKDLMHERKIQLRDVLKMRLDRQLKFLIQKPTLIGWAFIAFVGLSYCFSNEKDNNQKKANLEFQKQNENIERDRKRSDSVYVAKLENIDKGSVRRDTVIMQQLDKWGLTMRDSIITRKDEVPPTLTIDRMPTIDSQGNERLLTYILQSFNSDAHLLEIRYASANIKDGRLVETPKSWLTNSTNQTDIIMKEVVGVPHSVHAKSLFLDRGGALSVASDSFALAIEVYYKSKGNNRLPPLRKIFLVVKHSNSVLPVSNELFVRIAYYLKKYKVWTKFYDL